MSRSEMETLVEQVRYVMANPSATMPPTDDAALDRALADLSRRQRDGRQLEMPRLGFWEAPPVPARDPRA